MCTVIVSAGRVETLFCVLMLPCCPSHLSLHRVFSPCIPSDCKRAFCSRSITMRLAIIALNCGESWLEFGPVGGSGRCAFVDFVSALWPYSSRASRLQHSCPLPRRLPCERRGLQQGAQGEVRAQQGHVPLRPLKTRITYPCNLPGLSASASATH